MEVGSEEWQKTREAVRAACAGTPFVPVPIDQLASLYERFLRLTHMGTATIDAWQAMPKEIADIRHAIFAQSDFGALYAGQWLPKDVRAETYERVKAELRKP